MSDIGSLIASNTANTQAQVQKTAELASFKKGLEAEENTKLGLLETIPAPGGTDPAAGAADPSQRVGELINVRA
ncbi:MAG: hypothetical protein R3296_04145 [Oleiphilaceae bacterium]|nr:hypothetical protein [Oleiphilaceae bacterium]